MTDRELDRQVAERVMGLTKKRIEHLAKKDYESCMESQVGMGALGNEKWEKDCRKEKKVYFRDKQIPWYTTDPAVWMQVVERMREKGWDVMIVGIIGIPNGWRVQFSRLRHHPDEVDDAVLGRAICLAAVGVGT